MRVRAPRLLLATALAAVAAVGPTPAPALADEVATAQARVDALQRVAADTTDKLTEGTRKWEADQARLRALQVDLRNTQRHIADAQAKLAEQRLEVAVIARHLYANPLPRDVQIMVTLGPDDVLAAMHAQEALDLSARTGARVIAETETARHRLQSTEQQAEQLVSEASRLTKASADRLADLQDLAARTARELSSAQDALNDALTRRAVAQARAKAARERAARLAAAARYGGGGGATCTGKSTAGQSNGNLDPASLCPLWMAPGHRLVKEAAEAFNRMSQFHAQTQGSPLCVTDSYRSYSEQQSVYSRKPGLAAVPGTSNHGWGEAVDFCGGVESFGSSEHEWMQRNAGRFGWFHPDWARQGGSRPEAWHWEYGG